MRKKIIGIIVGTLLIATAVLPVTGTIDDTIKEMSINSDPEIPIWVKLPDESGNGIDVRCDRNDGIERILADDFRCTVTGKLTRIVIYGSWKNDVRGTMDKIHLSIHKDIPALESPTEYSMPGEELWSENFTVFNENLYKTGEEQWWWDPYIGEPLEDNHREIWSYEIDIPDNKAFKQLGTSNKPIIYWLDVYVEARGGEFGWKTSYPPEIDDAVYNISINPWWIELLYPPEHEYHNESIDLAMGIFSKIPDSPPILDIDPIPGPHFGTIVATVTNNGVSTIPGGVLFVFEIDASIMLLGAESSYETLEPLGKNESIEIKSSFIFGLGYATISIYAFIENEKVAEETTNGFVIGPFVWVLQ